MTVQVNDLPAIENNTLAHRLRAARDGAGYTRAKLSEITGIPTKSIEKFEIGSQEPNATRLMTLSEIFDISVDELLGLQEPPSSLGSVTAPVSQAGPIIQSPDVSIPDEYDPVKEILDELDEIRAEGLETSPRRVPALCRELRDLLGYLDPEELIALSEERELFEEDCPSAENLLETILGNFFQGNAECASVEDRIVDTALFGVDLFSIKFNALEKIADQIGVGPDLGIFWEGHLEIIKIMRPKLRELAVTGKGFNFLDRELFPRRKQ